MDPGQNLHSYIYDPEHETQNQLHMFTDDEYAADQPDPDIAKSLLNMLNEHNQLVKVFRYARERLE
jgi:hypothetical protein